jgi:hypothetical protein
MAEKPMSKAEKQAREMLLEMKAQKANTRAYDQADQTEPAPMVAPRPRPMPAPAQAMPQDQMGNATGMKKGGMIKKMASGGSASSRADGCATKGKTKGTMVSMKNGGMC